MVGLVEMLGGLTKDPKAKTFFGNALSDLGYGLTNAPDFGSALGTATRRTADMSGVRLAEEEKRKADQLAANQSNMTRELFAKQAPDLVPLMDAGMPVNELFGEYMRRMQPQGQAEPVKGINMDGRLVNPITGELIADYSTPKQPNAPSGYRFTPDGARLERIPGGPEDPAINAPMAELNVRRLNAQTDNVIGKIDEALGKVSWDSTGLLGQMTGAIGGTKAFDLRETAKTIKANLGFAELQAMRDASPTGGALGQVAVQELEALQSTLASINPDQSEEQLRQNLTLVKRLLERQKMFREQANAAKMGGGSAPMQTQMPAQNTPQRTLVYNPATGRLE